MNGLPAYFNALHPLSEGLLGYLKDVTVRSVIPRRTFLLREDEICSDLYFIEKGLVRCFYKRHKTEICSWFAKEFEVCPPVDSFFHQLPGRDNIETLEYTVIQSIRYGALYKIYELFPEFNITMRLLAEQNFLFSEWKLAELRLQRSHERYEWLMHGFGELIGRVPCKYLASYLGMTEVMMSIVRRRYKPNKIKTWSRNI